MPIYEYECKKCKAHSEVFQKTTDNPPVKCRKCGGRLEKIFSASAIQFKGSGWYVTDYAGKNKRSESGEEKRSRPENASSDDKARSKETSPVKKSSKDTPSTKVPSGD